MKKFICLECNEYATDIKRSFGSHLLKKHNMSPHEYYIKYNDIPDCIFCGDSLTKREFVSDTSGYHFKDHHVTGKCKSKYLSISNSKQGQSRVSNKIHWTNVVKYFDFWLEHRNNRNIVDPWSNKNIGELSITSYISRRIDFSDFKITDYIKFNDLEIKICEYCGKQLNPHIKSVFSIPKYTCNRSCGTSRRYTRIDKEKIKTGPSCCIHCRKKLKNGREYNSHIKLNNRVCLNCGRKICTKLLKSGKYCSHICYHEYKRNHPEKYIVTQKTKDKQSETMKQRIANGDFTPCITNSWGNTRIDINGKKYRSSWDAGFHMLNSNCQYEQIKIPYVWNNKIFNYIVDFIDESSKILYEIGPKSVKQNKKNTTKILAGEKWCEKNGYIFKLINEQYFIEHRDKIEYNMLYGDVDKMKKRLERIK